MSAISKLSKSFKLNYFHLTWQNDLNCLISSYFNVSVNLNLIFICIFPDGLLLLRRVLLEENRDIQCVRYHGQTILLTIHQESPQFCDNLKFCSLTPRKDQKVEVQDSQGKTEAILVRIKSS